MAGAVRQPIDTKSLSTYLGDNVPEVTLPVQIKQARDPATLIQASMLTIYGSLALGNPTLPIN